MTVIGEPMVFRNSRSSTLRVHLRKKMSADRPYSACWPSRTPEQPHWTDRNSLAYTKSERENSVPERRFFVEGSSSSSSCSSSNSSNSSSGGSSSGGGGGSRTSSRSIRT